MKIGIQVSSDLKQRTGVEEYIYQLIKHLSMLKNSKKHQFFLYSRENLKWPLKIGWTQIRLSLEMLRNKPDVLFVPAHTFPLIHPKLVVTIHGLEYENVPEAYSFWRRKTLRFLTKRNAKKAEKIIVPSQSTRKDLIKFYKINPKKIQVIPHGTMLETKLSTLKSKTKPYLLYLGSGHKRKNVEGLKKAFEILKEKYKIPHELILTGVEQHVDDNKKWALLKSAEIFVFPSFCEGFGFPVLEAQVVGAPVVASNTSSLPEILGKSALLVNPKNPSEIAGAIYKIIKNPKLKENLIKRGHENVKRFNWEKCARETFKILCV